MTTELRQIIREELQGACLVTHQGNMVPADPDAQRRVLGCLWDRNPIDLTGLEARHFFGPVHQWLFETLPALAGLGDQVKNPRDALLHAAMDHWSGNVSAVADIAQDVIEAEVTHPDSRRADVESIIEMWRRRELLRLLQSVELRVRMGTMDYEKAVARLGKGVRGG